MRSMKKEEVKNPLKKRKSTKYASKGASFGVIAAVLGVMIATVAKGMQLDKKEAAEKAASEDTTDNQ